MPPDYQRRFAYDDWANARFLETLSAHSPQPAMTVRWIGHVLAARWLWLERLSRRPQSHPVWPEWSLDECSRQHRGVSAAWGEYLRDLDASSLLLDVDYENSQGQSHRSATADILDHVLLHGAYHRGQIASTLRQSAIEPPHTDMIHATRSGALDA